MRDYASNVSRFQAIHVGPGAMNLLPDIVTGAMDKIFCVTGFANDFARHTVDLPAFDRAALRNIFLNEVHGGVARFSNDGEHFPVLLWNFIAQISDPRNIVIEAVWSQCFRPNIQEQEIVSTNERGTLRHWCVMRVSGMRADSDNRGGIGDYAVCAKLCDDPLLQVILRKFVDSGNSSCG